MKHCEQSEKCFYPIKTVQTQRDDGGKRHVSAHFGMKKKLNALRRISASQRAVAVVVGSEDAPGQRPTIWCGHSDGGRCEQDDAGVEIRLPENVCR